MNLSRHASTRSRQRAIPPLVLQWLEDFGSETYDGNGAVILCFDKRAKRRLESAMGKMPVQRMKEWLSAYAIVALDGTMITTGYRSKRVKH